jgi:hypothetical protein
MAAVGGDIIEVTYNHPTLGTGFFKAVVGEANTFQPGGFMNSDEETGLNAQGGLIIDKTRTRAFFEIVVESDLNVDEDLIRAKALAENTAPANWSISIVNGTIWSGSGVPVGAMDADIKASRFTLKVASGKFTRIA